MERKKNADEIQGNFNFFCLVHSCAPSNDTSSTACKLGTIVTLDIFGQHIPRYYFCGSIRREREREREKTKTKTKFRGFHPFISFNTANELKLCIALFKYFAVPWAEWRCSGYSLASMRGVGFIFFITTAVI